MHRMPLRFVSALITVAAGFALSLAVAAEQGPGARWVTAWATSQQTLGDTTMTDATVRLMARLTAAGESVRVRLDNTYGTTPLTIGAVSVGEPMLGSRLTPGSNQPVRFGGSARVTVPVGGSAVSDPVAITVLAHQDIAVSLYVPEADVQPSQHSGARVTSYLTADGAGDHTADKAADVFTRTTTSMFWLKSVDVLSSSSTGTIVAFGDSITDGSCATTDGHDRWEDWLAVRLHLDAEGGAHKAVVNEGIGGNTVTADVQPPPVSTPGVERLERDVLSHSGVTHVVLFMGTNDIRRNASAAQVIGGMEEIIDRVHGAGLKIIAATIIPRHYRPPTENFPWGPANDAIRDEVNAWIRGDAPFDGVLDFNREVRDPDDPNLIHSPFNCDGIHPNPLGYYRMGTSIDLTLFQDR